jgi:hypothetical protein
VLPSLFALFAAALLTLFPCASPVFAQDDDMDDILGGFEEEDPGFEVDREAIAEVEERWWDLSGSLETSASINYRSHESATGSDYGGLQRLRNRVNLQFDAEFPGEWKGRIEGWAFYDMAYLLNGRGNYTTQVRNEYEFDWDLREVYLQGAVHDRVDVKVGRQIVIWGRSESLRVLDILNPLDNREPGRVDLEDLRRPLAMGRVDGYLGDWTLSAFAIPEIRFDLIPPLGSDFLPVGESPVPGLQALPSEHKPDSFENWEFAGALTGTFSGWDISFHGAWYYDDRSRLKPAPSNPLLVKLVHDRLWMLGTGGNYTTGSWLLKGELVYLHGLGFEKVSSKAGVPVPPRSTDKSRVDALLGAEYYGMIDTTITLEVVNRQLIGYGNSLSLSRTLDALPDSEQEVSFRISRNFMNERLSVTALGILLSEELGDPAMIFRLGADYDLKDALVLGGGILIFQEGDFGPFDKWGQNDRFFLSLKWSF